VHAADAIRKAFLPRDDQYDAKHDVVHAVATDNLVAYRNSACHAASQPNDAISPPSNAFSFLPSSSVSLAIRYTLALSSAEARCADCRYNK